MTVQLLAYTPNPEKVVASAAKLCYSQSSASELMDGLTDEKAKKFIERLEKMGHESPLEHASFTFSIEGISRACSHQLVRHRLASYSQKSQRYTDENAINYVTPPEIDKDLNTSHIFADGVLAIYKVYAELCNRLFERYIESGFDKKSAEKKAIEDARYILPNACCTNLVMTMNARELTHFFKQRCCNRAQWEIRQLADEMLKICKDVAPSLFKYAGAPCVNGSCHEGEMSCGNPRKS